MGFIPKALKIPLFCLEISVITVFFLPNRIFLIVRNSKNISVMDNDLFKPLSLNFFAI